MHLQLCSAERRFLQCASTKGETAVTARGRSVSVERGKTRTQSAVVIKKYANRRLYNTATSTYVTLDDLADMVKAGTDFVVYDAKTGEEITRSVLTQIIFEEENKGTNLLPINFLRQLIRFYGDSMQKLRSPLSGISLDNLTRNRKSSASNCSIWTRSVQGHAGTRQAQHVDFQRRDALFNPFAAMAMNQRARHSRRRKANAQPREPQRTGAGKDDLQALKDQLSAMQRKIDAIASGK